MAIRLPGRGRYRPDRRQVTPEQLGYPEPEDATADVYHGGSKLPVAQQVTRAEPECSPRNLDHLTDAQLVQLRTSPVIGDELKKRIHAELEQRLGPDRAQKHVARATAAGVTETDIRMACRRWCEERGAELIVDTEQNRRGTSTRVTPGLSDLIVFWPDGRGVWYVETKRHPNKQTPAQKRFQQAVEKAGGIYILAYGTEDLEEVWRN